MGGEARALAHPPPPSPTFAPRVSATPSAPSGLEQGHPHVLWVGQRAGAGLAVLGRSGCGISVVARGTLLTELPGGVVLALLQGARVSATCYLAKFTPNHTPSKGFGNPLIWKFHIRAYLKEIVREGHNEFTTGCSIHLSGVFESTMLETHQEKKELRKLKKEIPSKKLSKRILIAFLTFFYLNTCNITGKYPLGYMGAEFWK